VLANAGPGKFVVIEGLDGAGTTTQVRLLSARLGRDRPVHVTYEPTDGPVGLQIRLILGKRVHTTAAVLAALFAADRMDHLHREDGEGGIVAHLRAGTDVISDRYYLSSFAYQGMSEGWDWIWEMHRYCVRPDLTLFVDVPVDVCLERIAAGRGDHFDLFERRETLDRVRESYLGAIDRLQHSGERIEVVNGDAPSKGVHEAIWRQVTSLS
jgi:dTMP kinase